MSIKKFGTTVKAGENFEAICETRNHKIIIDEPVEDGGKDLGMTPVEVLLAAIGS